MNWMIFTILAIVFRAIYGITTKLLSSRVHSSAITQSFLLTAVACILSIPLGVVIGGFNFSGVSSVWGIVLLSIISSSLGNIVYFAGMKDIEASTSQIAFSSILIWGGFLSVVFLGSRFSFLQIAGIALLFIAILMTQITNKKVIFTKGALFIIASAVLFAIFQITSAEVSTVVSPGAYLILSYFGQSAILGLVYARKITSEMKKMATDTKRVATTTILTSSMTLLYFTFSYFAYRYAPDRGIVVLLLPAQVILAVILGIIFLRERTHVARKIVAGILAFVAAVLIKS